jgi:hypothetical protein
LILLLILAGMIGWTIRILASDQPEKPSWLLVPLTVIYAVLTLWMAAAAFQNAQAARRSAEAMEASVEEQRLSRWAAFAANLSFPQGYTYRQETDGSLSIVLGNLFRQPIIGLRAVVWFMDQNAGSDGQVRYSTMMESEVLDIDHDTHTITLQVKPTKRPEADRVQLGEFALRRFREVFQNQVPKSTLCLLTYSHRANLATQHFVYDIVPVPNAAPREASSHPPQTASGSVS